MKKAPKSAAKHVNQLANDWHKVKSALTNAESDVTSIADDVVEHSIGMIKDQSNEIQKSVSNYVTKHPLHVLGIALVVGAVIGNRLKR